MYRFIKRSIYAVLIPLALISDSKAQDNGMAVDDFPGLQGFMQVGDAETSDEHLATEIGSMGNVPVDGGLSLLLAAGAAFGARRLRRRNID
jgi:hypothetical protein